MKALPTHLLTLILAASFAMTACTAQKRDEAWSQGQGENMETVADYDGKRFKVQTLNAVGDDGTAPTAAAASQTKINSKSKDIIFFPIVNYKTDAKLVGTTPIKGRPNYGGYEIVYKVSDNYLKVFKVANKKDIPLDEQTYAEKDGDLLAVPLIGYPIQEFVNVDNVRNERDEATYKLTEKKAVGKAGAKFFRFDRNGGQIFKAVVKNSVFPKKLFQDEWYYAETVVATPVDKQTELGSNLNVDQNLEPSNRIKFVLSENLLKVVSLNVDQRLDAKDDVNLQSALVAPISWLSYKTRLRGNTTELEEEVDNTIHWTNRDFVSVDFDRVASIENSAALGKIVELEVSDDYIGFTIYKQLENKRIRYSFVRVKDRNYVAKNYHEKDTKIFGFFSTQKSTLANFEIRRKEDVYKNIFINRFNPKVTNAETGEREIVFHFTDTTPKCTEEELAQKICLREASKIAVQNWDHAFQMAGTGIHVRLDDANDVKLGDLRYNSINLIDSLLESNLYGFGPSVADPYTGEIISATTNMHITPIRSTIIDEIRLYIRQELGQLKENYAFNRAQLKALGVMSPTADPLLSDIKIEEAKTPDGTLSATGSGLKNLTGIKIFEKDSSTNKLVKKNIQFKNTAKNYGREFDLGLSSGNIHEDIKATCPEVDQYISDLKAQKKDFNDNELPILNKCSKKMVVNKMLGTLVHEMGHNFGLRHNFRASTDELNFYPADKNGRQAHSSSVMEYTAFNEDRLITPGMYDIAAIRFGYADSIAQVQKLADGAVKDLKVIKLDVKKTIDENIASNAGFQQNSYMYCTDEDVDYYAVDPLCMRHDAGVKAVNVVQNLIKDYNTSFATYNRRYDALTIPNPTRLQIYRFSRFFVPMKAIYDEWRSQVASYVGLQNKYLENYSKEEYAAILKKMEIDPRFKDKYAEYKPAADLINAFMYSLANLPVKYCVAENNASKKLELIELESLRNKVGFLKSVKIQNCKDKELVAAFNDLGVTQIEETGLFFDDIRFETSTDSSKEKLDVIGTSYDRAWAGTFPSFRFVSSTVMTQNSFMPALLDEPVYREQWIRMTTDRVLKGLDMKSIKDDLKVKLPGRDLDKDLVGAEQKFATEGALAVQNIENLMNGLAIPGKIDATQERLRSFRAYRSRNPEMIKQAQAKIDLADGSTYLTLDPKSLFSMEIIKRFDSVSNLVRAGKAPVNLKAYESLAAYTDLIPTQAQQKGAMTLLELGQVINALAEKTRAEKDEAIQGKVGPIVNMYISFYQKVSAAILNAKKDELTKELGPELSAKVFAGQELSEQETAKVNEISEKVTGSINVVPLVVTGENKVFPAFRESFAAFVEARKQNEIKSRAEYMRNQDDIDGQLDMLIRIMHLAPEA